MNYRKALTAGATAVYLILGNLGSSAQEAPPLIPIDQQAPQETPKQKETRLKQEAKALANTREMQVLKEMERAENPGDVRLEGMVQSLLVPGDVEKEMTVTETDKGTVTRRTSSWTMGAGAKVKIKDTPVEIPNVVEAGVESSTDMVVTPSIPTFKDETDTQFKRMQDGEHSSMVNREGAATATMTTDTNLQSGVLGGAISVKTDPSPTTSTTPSSEAALAKHQAKEAAAKVEKAKAEANPFKAVRGKSTTVKKVKSERERIQDQIERMDRVNPIMRDMDRGRTTIDVGRDTFDTRSSPVLIDMIKQGTEG